MGHSACIILSVIFVLCFTVKRFSRYSQQLPFFTAFFGCSEMQAFMRSAFLARFPECEFFFVLQDPGCFFHFLLLFFVLLGDPQASRSCACRVRAPRGVLFSMLLVLPRGIFHFFRICLSNALVQNHPVSSRAGVRFAEHPTFEGLLPSGCMAIFPNFF